ncbi:hypothetical protein A8F94_01085 [Bacillus sp. FJAT-27225]|uniref:hypothetical protein n=1 Tax=Bacillus sp. FJAT-27225 TaxID=1743144 RepID=UPI00080C30B3|nr:hypothetical protein [Bacillus sp. FJAT-27225]OCA90511.1 hypothetical protein A8F94_01085 [Bacillus sp. FJAT-27225]
MALWIPWLLPVQIVAAVACFIFIYPKRKLIGFHLGMNISMVTGGGMALGAGIIMINLFPLHYKEVTIMAILVGMAAGTLFGALFDYQTVLSGFFNGLMMGVMAPMVGTAAAEGPLFILFIQIFLIGSFVLLILSVNSS